MSRKYATGTRRGRPFEKGNPGRPKGALNRATRAAQALLDGEAEQLTRVAVQAALGGDMTALRLCLDRIVPPRRDRPVEVEIPSISGSPIDIVAALATVVAAVAAGDITPAEGKDVAALLEIQRRTAETVDLERRITDLERRHP